MTAFARSYARAFLEAAPTGYDADRFLESAGAVSRAVTREPRLKAFFLAPAVPQTAKEKAIDDLSRRAAVDDFGVRLLKLLLENRRILQLPEILAALRQESDRRRGIVEARVTVASPIGPDDERRIAERLGRAVGKTVRLRIDVDGSILAGFVARVGSEVFDASVLRAIDAFSEQAKEAAGA